MPRRRDRRGKFIALDAYLRWDGQARVLRHWEAPDEPVGSPLQGLLTFVAVLGAIAALVGCGLFWAWLVAAGCALALLGAAAAFCVHVRGDPDGDR